MKSSMEVDSDKKIGYEYKPYKVHILNSEEIRTVYGISMHNVAETIIQQYVTKYDDFIIILIEITDEEGRVSKFQCFANMGIDYKILEIKEQEKDT